MLETHHKKFNQIYVSENFILQRNDTIGFDSYYNEKVVEEAYQVVGEDIVFFRERVLYDDTFYTGSSHISSNDTDINKLLYVGFDPNETQKLVVFTVINSTIDNTTYVVKEWVYGSLTDYTTNSSSS